MEINNSDKKNKVCRKSLKSVVKGSEVK